MRLLPRVLPESLLAATRVAQVGLHSRDHVVFSQQPLPPLLEVAQTVFADPRVAAVAVLEQIAIFAGLHRSASWVQIPSLGRRRCQMNQRPSLEPLPLAPIWAPRQQHWHPLYGRCTRQVAG